MMNEESYLLFFGDALELLKGLDTASIDLIVTSPTYADSRSNTYGGINPIFTMHGSYPSQKNFYVY